MGRERASAIETWINEALSDVDKVDASGRRLPCTTLVLVHMVGTDESEVHGIKIGVADYTPRTLAERFMTKAENYVRFMTGLQTFNLQAFYDGSTVVGARMIFTAMPPSFDTGLTTEAPTPTGQVQQGMRHVDMAFMSMMRQQTACNQILLDFADRQSQYVRHLETENRETFMVLKDAIRTRQLDQYDRDKELLKMERTNKIIEQVVKFGPLLANTVTGKELFPRNMTDTTLVETVAERVTPDKLMKLAEVFGDDPAILAALMSRVETYHKQRAATEAALQTRPVPGAGDGESDAAGGLR